MVPLEFIQSRRPLVTSDPIHEPQVPRVMSPNCGAASESGHTTRVNSRGVMSSSWAASKPTEDMRPIGAMMLRPYMYTSPHLKASRSSHRDHVCHRTVARGVVHGGEDPRDRRGP